MIIGVALILSGALPFLPDGLRMALENLPATSQGASTALGVEQGLPSYGGYPSPSNCNSGESLCYPNTRIGVVSVRDQGGASGAGETKYINLAGTVSATGIPVVLTNLNPTTIEWACQPSQTVTWQHLHSQTCPRSCGFLNTQTCWDDCSFFHTHTDTYTMSPGASGSGGAFAASGLTGSATLTYPVGTYAPGEVVPYTLSCNYGTPVTINVTMGSTITQTTLSANPTTVRAGLDTSTLTITASSAVAGSCKLIDPDGSTLKTYSGTSVNDTVVVGPFGNQVTSPQTYQIVCIGPEGFNSRKSVSLTVKFPPNLSITANNVLTKILIPPATSADIRWTSSNQLPNSCSVSYTTTGGSCVAGAKSIATQGAYNWKTFTIGTDTYLALANAYDGISYNTNSKIYKWVPSLACFGKDASSVCGTAYQLIATNGAAKWESFTIGADTYLAVANSRNDVTRIVDSKIYKWTIAAGCPASGGLGDGTTCDAVYQSISTSGAVDIKPIIVGTNTYLAVANYRNDASNEISYGINSAIYKWLSAQSCFGSGTTCGSVLQVIPTKGAYRMEAFTLEGGSYLAVTNAFDPTIGVGYNQPSYIYKFIGSGYNCPVGGGFGNAEYGSCGTPFQVIDTSGAYGFEFFTAGNSSYLAVANSYNGTSFNINSKIYKWITGLKCFGDGITCGTAFQAIPTSGATQLQTFSTGPDTYLIAANAYNGSSYNINSNFYQWMPGSQCFGNGTACGSAFQSVPTSGAAWWEPVTISGNIYLATANYFNGTTRNINSSIMQWSPSGCGDTEFGTPTVWTGDNSGLDPTPTIVYLTSGTSWTVPSDWNSTNNTIEVIGGGGNGGTGSAQNGGGGGGGGAYSKKINVSLTAGASVTYAIGSIAGDTYFCNSTSNCASISGNAIIAGAKGGTSGSGTIPGAGGTSATNGVGDTKFSGGTGFTNGADGNSSSGGGGGGAAGPNGIGNASTGNSGASGDAGFGGAGGATGFPPSPGSAGTEWNSTHGSGGGGGGANNGGSPDGIGGAGGLYGAGGGGGYANRAGGAGAAGIIRISYYPYSSVVYQTGLFSGSRLYALGCKWLDGTTASSTSVKVTTQAELMLSANGSTTPTVYITPNTSALVQWSTKSIQQNSCTVTSANAYGWPTDNWVADNNPTGYSSPVLADGQSVVYTLACIDLAGDNASKVMTVTAATQLPSATSDMSISIKRVVRGGRPTLTWSAINLNPGISCSVTPALQSGVPTWDGTGTSWSSPLGGALGPIINTTTTFTLWCVNKAGNSASVSATAYLVPAFKEL